MCVLVFSLVNIRSTSTIRAVVTGSTFLPWWRMDPFNVLTLKMLSFDSKTTFCFQLLVVQCLSRCKILSFVFLCTWPTTGQQLTQYWFFFNYFIICETKKKWSVQCPRAQSKIASFVQKKEKIPKSIIKKDPFDRFINRFLQLQLTALTIVFKNYNNFKKVAFLSLVMLSFISPFKV